MPISPSPSTTSFQMRSSPPSSRASVRQNLTRDEAVAYDVAAALTGGGVLPELTYRAAVDAFGVHGAAEVCYLIGLYCLVSVTLNGFDVPVPEPEEGPV
jgi:4-carboxymuconolactone decarboxylase